MPDYQGWRSWMLENFEILNISIWDNSQGDVFDGITMSDVVTIVSRRVTKPNNTAVEFVSYKGQPFTINLTNQSNNAYSDTLKINFSVIHVLSA